MVEVVPEKPVNFHWEGHGLKVHIPVGAISSRPVTICIQASLGGKYKLPDDSVLVSGVYWLSLHPPVKKFHKEVAISLQHCASDDDSTLSFITAKCTQATLPYTFKAVAGGSFSQPWDGSIDVDNFSAKAICGKKSLPKLLNYAIRTYYVPRNRNTYEAHITITQKKDLVMKVIQIFML